MKKIPEIILTLPLEEKTSKPEGDALKYFKINGWDGVNDEGEMLFLLLKSSFFLNLPKTAYMLSKGEKNNNNYFGVYHRRITEQMKFQPSKRYWPFSEWGEVKDRIEDIKEVTVDKVLFNFNLIKNYTYCRNLDGDWYLYYEKYSDIQVANAFHALGNDMLVDIFRITCGEYNDTVRHDVGWPDLMMWKQDKIIFREVKTKNDKIRKNQIDVYKSVFVNMNIDYKVLRLLYE